MTTFTQTQIAQELGQYKQTSTDTLKSIVDFIIEQMNPIYIRLNSGESKIVNKKELIKMQKSMTWTTNF
jgi:hypothetical protein